MTLPALRNAPGRCAHGYHIETQHPALCQCEAHDEWPILVRALRTVAAEHDNEVDWTHVRPLIRGRIYHKHIGTLTTRAKHLGLIEEVDVRRSRDYAGKNAGRWESVYRWTGVAA